MRHFEYFCAWIALVLTLIIWLKECSHARTPALNVQNSIMNLHYSIYHADWKNVQHCAELMCTWLKVLGMQMYKCQNITLFNVYTYINFNLTYLANIQVSCCNTELHKSSLYACNCCTKGGLINSSRCKATYTCMQYPP